MPLPYGLMKFLVYAIMKLDLFPIKNETKNVTTTYARLLDFVASLVSFKTLVCTRT